MEFATRNLRKVKILLDALERAQKNVEYFALDLSYDELQRTFAELDLSKFQYVTFNAFHGTYDDGLAWLSNPENRTKPTVVLSLGSSMGNFTRSEAAQFLLGYSQALSSEDVVIIGLDATTDGDRVFKAYNDSKGVTEQFYRNGLAHANSIIGYEAFKGDEWDVEGEYVKADNKHQASYVALKDVEIDGISIKKGERLPFEQANKYRADQSHELWQKAGLVPKATYSDSIGKHRMFMRETAGFADRVYRSTRNEACNHRV